MNVAMTPVFDGLIHVLFFFITSAGLFFLLNTIAREFYFKSVKRIGIVVAIPALLLAFGEPFSVQFFPSAHLLLMIILLFGVGVGLTRKLLQTSWLITAVVGGVLVSSTFTLHNVAPKVSAAVLPEGDTLMQYVRGAAQSALEKKSRADRAALIAAPLADEQEQAEKAAMKSDFERGVALFSARKEWMDNMTAEERHEYETEMAAFRGEQGIDADRHSLEAAQRQAESANMSKLASLVGGLKAGNTIVSNAVARSFSDSPAVEATPRAPATSGKSRRKEGGESLLNTVVSALSKNESPPSTGTSSDAGKSFNMDSIAAVLSRSPKSTPKADSTTALEPVAVSEMKIGQDFAPAETMIPITVRLGVVRVPAAEAERGDWISVVQMLRVQGFASIGSETVVLLESGAMHRSGDVLEFVDSEYAYRFRIDHIQQGKVLLSAVERIENAVN